MLDCNISSFASRTIRSDTYAVYFCTIFNNVAHVRLYPGSPDEFDVVGYTDKSMTVFVLDVDPMGF